MSSIQLSLFDPAQGLVQAPAPSSDKDTDDSLLKYWSNSEDLAACMVNVLLHPNELLFEFVEYIKTCRLSEVAEEVPRPSPHKRFDRMADCLRRLEFSQCERGDGEDVIRMETTVLDFAIDISFDERELEELRTFGIAGASIQDVEGLTKAIRKHVEEAEVIDTRESHLRLDESHGCHPYIRMLRQLGIPEESIPEPSDKEAVLKNCSVFPTHVGMNRAGSSVGR